MVNSYLDNLTEQSSIQQQNILIDQLNELVSRNLLIVEQTQPTLIQDSEGRISLQQSIKLTLKDIEYIKNLEEQINNMKNKIEYYEDILKPAKHFKNE